MIVFSVSVIVHWLHVIVLVAIVLVSAIVLRVALVETAIGAVAREASIMLRAVVIETVGDIVTMVIIILIVMVGIIVTVLVTMAIIVVGVKRLGRSVVLCLPLFLLIQLLL